MKTPISVSLLLAAALANADTIYVSPNGSGTQDGSSFDNACAGIAAAYAKVNKNDVVTIRLAADTYPITEALTMYKTANVTILGDADHPQNVILDGGGAATGFFTISKSTTLRGLTIQNAASTNKAQAVYASSSSTVLCIDRCRFSCLTNSVGGAAIKNASAQLVVSNCTFLACATTTTGSADGGGAVSGSSASVLVGCTFRNCTSTVSGGGVFEFDRLEDCSFHSCTAVSGGGAVGAYQSTATSVTGCTFVANQAISDSSAYCGGAVSIRGKSTVFEDCTFMTNRSGCACGAIYSSGENSLHRCRFYGNVSMSGCGAASTMKLVEDCVFCGNISSNIIAKKNAYGVLGMSYQQDEAKVLRSTFVGNYTDGYGGAVYFGCKTNGYVEACSFVSNTNNCNGYGGGAIHVGNGALYVRNSLFAKNVHVSRGASAIDGTVDSKTKAPLYSMPLLENCTFVSNDVSSAPVSYPVVTRIEGVTNCLFYSNLDRSGVCHFSSDQDYAGFAYCASDDDKLTALPNCFKLTKYPFVGGDDFTLKKRAQPIDKGLKLPWMTAEAKDLAGKRRVIGAAPDLGCCEYEFPGFLLMLR